jgi:hypothetical protein
VFRRWESNKLVFFRLDPYLVEIPNGDELALAECTRTTVDVPVIKFSREIALHVPAAVLE